MILYTTYNKYCVSYILLFDRIYVGFCLSASFFSVCFLLFIFVDFFSRCYSQRVSPSFHRIGGEEVDEGVSDANPDSSCLCLVLLLFLFPFPMMPAVAGFLLLLELLQVFGLEGAQQWVSELPVVLAVLIDQAHLWLAEDGQQVLVLAWAGGPLGTAGVERRGHQSPPTLHQQVVDSSARQHYQLQFHERVFEVLLCGRALVHAGVRWLQRPQEKTLLCLQNPAVGAHLQRRGKNRPWTQRSHLPWKLLDRVIVCGKLFSIVIYMSANYTYIETKKGKTGLVLCYSPHEKKRSCC